MRQTERLPWRLSYATSAWLLGAPGLDEPRGGSRRRLRLPASRRGASRRSTLACGRHARGERRSSYIPLAAARSSDASELGAQGTLPARRHGLGLARGVGGVVAGRKKSSKQTAERDGNEQWMCWGRIDRMADWPWRSTGDGAPRGALAFYGAHQTVCGRAWLAELEIRIAPPVRFKSGNGCHRLP